MAKTSNGCILVSCLRKIVFLCSFANEKKGMLPLLTDLRCNKIVGFFLFLIYCSSISGGCWYALNWISSLIHNFLFFHSVQFNFVCFSYSIEIFYKLFYCYLFGIYVFGIWEIICQFGIINAAKQTKQQHFIKITHTRTSQLSFILFYCFLIISISRHLLKLLKLVILKLLTIISYIRMHTLFLRLSFSFWNEILISISSLKSISYK